MSVKNLQQAYKLWILAGVILFLIIPNLSSSDTTISEKLLLVETLEDAINAALPCAEIELSHEDEPQFKAYKNRRDKLRVSMEPITIFCKKSITDIGPMPPDEPVSPPNPPSDPIVTPNVQNITLTYGESPGRVDPTDETPLVISKYLITFQGETIEVPGDQMGYTFPMQPDNVYNIELRAEDSYGNVSPDANVIVITLGPNGELSVTPDSIQVISN